MSSKMERLSPHELYSLTSVTVYSVKKDSCAAWKLSEKKGVSRFPHIGGTRYLQLFVLIPTLVRVLLLPNSVSICVGFIPGIY